MENVYAEKLVQAWQDSTSLALLQLMDGRERSLDSLTSLIADGKMAPGQWECPDGESGQAGEPACQRPRSPTEFEITALARKAFFGFAVPGLWRRSGTYAFVLDSGQGCNGNPLSKYVDHETAKAAGVCNNGRLYYLVQPKGDATTCWCNYYDNGHCNRACANNKFSAPTGLGSLNMEDYGGVTKEDIVAGALATWSYNGKQNKEVSLADLATKPDVRRGLVGMDVNTPGVVQLPVCSPDRAFQSWNTARAGSSPHYPCDIPPGKDHCGASSFENTGSDVSPLVSDCQQVIKNIEGDASTVFTHSITGHREILKFGTCRFGIERTGGTGGTVQFMVGGQDVIDLINDAIKQFGGGGRVGAKGVMPCAGVTVNTKVDVLWGIY
ncbi:hypothetical protein RB595_001650 [Gaeumannomyces hyphopodioides]